MNDRSSRDWFAFIVFAVIALALIGRLFYVQIIKGREYSAAAEQQRTQTIDLPAQRGTIYDRNGNVLATTVDATTIYANPIDVQDAQTTAEAIAGVLGGTADDYIDSLTRTDTSFVYIKRKADVDVAAQLKALNLPGIYFLDDSKRVYPYEGVGSQVIGLSNVDNKGISGIELQYDDVLSGTDGRMLVQTGLNGTPISGGVTSEDDAVDGQDVILSLDIHLQQYVETELANAITSTGATGGSITIYDASTGEVYASVSEPELNTGQDWRSTSASDAFTLKTVSNAYEPGSTFKAVTAAALLDSNSITLDTEVDVPSELDVDDYVIHDWYAHDDLTMPFWQVIAESSNIGTALASRNMSSTAYYDYLQKFGFGSDPGIDFPGASAGILPDVSTWSGSTAANIPFGQGVSVSEIQLLRAYGAFVDDGTIRQPHFLMDIPSSDDDISWSSSQVISSATATTMRDLLRRVVTDGTAGSASVDGYAAAGKTGSAQVASASGGYQADVYNVSFCGFLSDTDSELICLVVLDDTDSGNANPVFADVMRYTADLYQIEPNSAAS